MKRFCMLFICICLSLSHLSFTAAAAPQWPDSVSIESDGGILMDSDTGMEKTWISPIILPASQRS